MNVFSETIRTIKNWWLFVVLGVLMIICGIMVLMTPVESYLTLAVMFSVIVFVNGIFEIYFSISNRKVIEGYGWYLAGGIGKTLIGIVLMVYPGISVAILPAIVGFWLMFGAISTIAGAFDLKSYHVNGWGWVLSAGILLLIFSFFVIALPVFGSGVIVALTGIAVLTYGVSYIAFGVQLRQIKKLVSNLKKATLSGLSDLRNQVIRAIEHIEESDKEEVRKRFDVYQSSMD